MTTNEKALEILSKTSDGNKLAPRDLYLLQEAVNGNLSELGMQAFDKLHEQVNAGTYDRAKVYYYDVEHMIKDGQGYIYYKGKHVEHFSYRNTQADRAREKADLLALKARCELLEKKGIEVDAATAVWEVEKYLTEEELNAIANQYKIAA